MKWLSQLVADEVRSTTVADELDRIEEHLTSAHNLIKHIAIPHYTTTEHIDEHAELCQQWLEKHPEPEEENGSE